MGRRPLALLLALCALSAGVPGGATACSIRTAPAPDMAACHESQPDPGASHVAPLPAPCCGSHAVCGLCGAAGVAAAPGLSCTGPVPAGGQTPAAIRFPAAAPRRGVDHVPLA